MSDLSSVPPPLPALPFSRTFMLALDRDLHAPHSRTHKTLDHLNAMGIQAEIYAGFDGSITGLITENTYELDHPGTNYRIGPRTTSLYMGHVSMWRMCELLEGDSFLFLEDDVRFKPDWRNHFDYALPALPEDWDLLYIGSCCCEGHGHEPKQVSGHLHQVDYALCTHAYAVARKALPIMRRACEKVYAGVDIAMCLHAIPWLKTYAFLPRLADQFETDIAP